MTTLRARFNPGRPANSAVNLILPMLEGTGTRRAWSSAEGNPWYDVTPSGAAILGRVQADGELLERGGKGGPLFQIVEADEAARIDKTEAAAARRTRRVAPADGEWTAEDFANLGITPRACAADTRNEQPAPAAPAAAAGTTPAGEGSAAKRVGRRPPVTTTAKQATTATPPMAEVKFSTPTAELPFQGLPPPAPETPLAPPTPTEGETSPTAAG